MSTSAVKRLGKETAIYGLSTIFARVLNFLLTPFYTAVFTPGDFGIYSIFFSLIAFLNIIFAFSLPQAYLRFASDYEGNERRILFSTLQFVLICITIVFGLSIYGFRTELLSSFNLTDKLTTYVFWMVAILVLDVWSLIPFSHLRLENKSLLFSSIKLVNIVVNIAMNYWFLVIVKTGLIGVFYANAIASGISLIIVLVFTAKSFSPKLNLNWNFLKPLLLFAIPLIPGGIGTMFNEVADRLFIQHLSPETISGIYSSSQFTAQDLTGIYSACYKLGIFMMLVVQMFSMAWQPFYLAESKKENAPQTLGKIFELYFAGLLFFGLLLALFMDNLVSVSFFGFHLIDKAYWMGLTIVPIIILAYIFSGIHNFFYIGMILKKKSKDLLSINLIGVFVTFVGNLILLPIIGIMGSALTTMLCYLVMCVFQIRKSQSFYPLTINWKRISLFAVLSIPAWILTVWQQQNPFMSVPEKFILVILFALSLFLFKIVSKDQIMLFAKRF